MGIRCLAERHFSKQKKKQTIFLVIGVLKVNTELKQEMSQLRDDCPKRNRSSMRHNGGKLFEIKEIYS